MGNDIIWSFIGAPPKIQGRVTDQLSDATERSDASLVLAAARPAMPKSSDDGSGDEDDAAGIQAQVAQMLNPINSKLKKATKKISALDALVDGLKKF